MGNKEVPIVYPRRRVLRRVLSWSARHVFEVLSQMEVEGQENAPRQGPLIVVANHFSFLDPAMMVGIAPWPLEFIGGFRMPNAPPVVKWIPRMWGILPVFRGTGSRAALRSAEIVLNQGGILGIYPEASSAHAFLRPARPGTAFLAARTGAQILPIGFDGLTNFFPRLRQGRRPRVRVRIGRPFGPYHVVGRGRERRRQLNEIGHDIMSHIAELIPPESRGHYAEDPLIREQAQAVDYYPWDHETELED